MMFISYLVTWNCISDRWHSWFGTVIKHWSVRVDCIRSCVSCDTNVSECGIWRPTWRTAGAG